MKDLQTEERREMLKNINKPAEMNFVNAVLVLIISFAFLTIILPLLQRAADIQSLPDCELHGDCAEIIKNINR